MLSAITDFSTSKRGKWIVIALWLVASAIVVPLSPSLDEVERNDQAAFLPSGAESTRVVALVEERFPGAGTPAIIVLRNEDGLTGDNRAAAQALSEWLASDAAPENIVSVISVFNEPLAGGSLLSVDGTTMTMIVDIAGEPAGEPYLAAIGAIRDRISGIESAGLEIRVSGPGGLIKDLIEVFGRIDGLLLLVTAALVLVLLIVIYRSPVVAFVPLFTVGWVFALAAAVGALFAREFGLPVSGQARGIMTVLLFGAGTDYCLFISSRYREELTRVQDKGEAMRRTMRAVGEAIAASAGTVLIATLMLLLAVLESNRALGPLLSVAVALMLAAALTLIPAILAVLGRFAFWPFRPAYDASLSPGDADEVKGAWGRWAAAVLRRPVLFLGLSTALFLVMASGVPRLNQTFDSIAALPAGTESREGFEFLREAFPAGELAPTEGYLVLEPGQSAWDQLAAIDRVTQGIAGIDGVASVTGPSRPFGSAAEIGPMEVSAAAARFAGHSPPVAPPDSPEALAFATFMAANRFVSPDGEVARLDIVLAKNPYSIEAITRIEELRATARALSGEAGLAGDVLIGGETAIQFDTKLAADRDEVVVLPLILLAIGIVLGLLLRSIVAPVYLMLTIVISYFGTLGLSTVVFQDVLGHDGVGSSVPFFLFVFLVALGVDYNIYLMARIREEARTHGLETGTRRALARTGGVITSAGIILAGTFSALMTLPLQDLFQVGFAVAAGVLLDTFVVRTMMVPAIVLLLGRWNWWPSAASRREVERGTPEAALREPPPRAGNVNVV